MGEGLGRERRTSSTAAVGCGRCWTSGPRQPWMPVDTRADPLRHPVCKPAAHPMVSADVLARGGQDTKPLSAPIRGRARFTSSEPPLRGPLVHPQRCVHQGPDAPWGRATLATRPHLEQQPLSERVPCGKRRALVRQWACVPSDGWRGRWLLESHAAKSRYRPPTVKAIIAASSGN